MKFYRCDDQCFEITVVIKSDVDEWQYSEKHYSFKWFELQFFSFSYSNKWLCWLNAEPNLHFKPS